MKKHIAKKWAEALRSGKYKQGYNRLRDEKNNFCCLGVLCNLHANEFPKLAKTQSDPLSYLGEEDSLPKEVLEWSGLSDSLGELKEIDWWDEDDTRIFDRYTSLAEANDEGVKFKKIADWIEQNYEKI